LFGFREPLNDDHPSPGLQKLPWFWRFSAGCWFERLSASKRERESFTWKCQVTWEPVLRVVCSVSREVFLIVDVWEMINIYTDFLHTKIQNIYIIYNIYIYIIYVHIPNSRSTRYHRILARRVVIGFKKRCLAGLRPYTDGTKTTNLRYFRSRHLISTW
jgi:hypothetical protein